MERPFVTEPPLIYHKKVGQKMETTGKKVLNVTAISIFSKLLTMVGVVLYQSQFGIFSHELNAFNYAQTLQSSIFTILGTTLTTIIVPVYSSFLARGEAERGKKYIDNILTLAMLFVILLTAILQLLAPWIISTTDFTPNRWDFSIFALRLLTPVMIFFTLRDVITGFLQSHGKFNMAAAVSIPSALITIFYSFFLSEKFGVQGLVIATLIGYSLQALILLPSAARTGYRYKFSPGLGNPDVLASLKLVPSVLLGVSAYQINQLYNNNLSTHGNRPGNFHKALLSSG